jgi:hypothetical protein
VAVLALAALTAGPAVAQDSLPLRPGDRVRITLPRLPARTQPRVYTGTLVALRGQAISVGIRRDTTTFALDSVLALEVSRGRVTRERTTAAVGAALGLVVGFAIGHLRHPAAEDPDAGQIATVTVIGGFLGTAAGVAVGLQMKTDRWEAVRY